MPDSMIQDSGHQQIVYPMGRLEEPVSDGWARARVHSKLFLSYHPFQENIYTGLHIASNKVVCKLGDKVITILLSHYFSSQLSLIPRPHTFSPYPSLCSLGMGLQPVRSQAGIQAFHLRFYSDRKPEFKANQALGHSVGDTSTYCNILHSASIWLICFCVEIFDFGTTFIAYRIFVGLCTHSNTQ